MKVINIKVTLINTLLVFVFFLFSTLSKAENQLFPGIVSVSSEYFDEAMEEQKLVRIRGMGILVKFPSENRYVVITNAHLAQGKNLIIKSFANENIIVMPKTPIKKYFKNDLDIEIIEIDTSQLNDDLVPFLFQREIPSNSAESNMPDSILDFKIVLNFADKEKDAFSFHSNNNLNEYNFMNQFKIFLLGGTQLFFPLIQPEASSYFRSQKLLNMAELLAPNPSVDEILNTYSSGINSFDSNWLVLNLNIRNGMSGMPLLSYNITNNEVFVKGLARASALYSSNSIFVPESSILFNLNQFIKGYDIKDNLFSIKWKFNSKIGVFRDYTNSIQKYNFLESSISIITQNTGGGDSADHSDYDFIRSSPKRVIYSKDENPNVIGNIYKYESDHDYSIGMYSPNKQDQIIAFKINHPPFLNKVQAYLGTDYYISANHYGLILSQYISKLSNHNDNYTTITPVYAKEFKLLDLVKTRTKYLRPIHYHSTLNHPCLISKSQLSENEILEITIRNHFKPNTLFNPMSETKIKLPLNEIEKDIRLNRFNPFIALKDGPTLNISGLFMVDALNINKSGLNISKLHEIYPNLKSNETKLNLFNNKLLHHMIALPYLYYEGIPGLNPMPYFCDFKE